MRTRTLGMLQSVRSKCKGSNSSKRSREKTSWKHEPHEQGGLSNLGIINYLAHVTRVESYLAPNDDYVVCYDAFIDVSCDGYSSSFDLAIIIRAFRAESRPKERKLFKHCTEHQIRKMTV